MFLDIPCGDCTGNVPKNDLWLQEKEKGRNETGEPEAPHPPPPPQKKADILCGHRLDE